MFKSIISVSSFIACNALNAKTEKLCPEEIIRGAKEAGVMAYLYNCLLHPGGTVGAQVCLSRFIEKFDLPGNCRDVYQRFVNELMDGAIALDTANCDGYPLDSDAQIPWRCLAIPGSTAIGNFHDATGFFPSYPACSAALVRKYSKQNPIGYSLIKSWIANDGLAVSYAIPFVYDNVPCDVCYENVFYLMLDGDHLNFGHNPALVEACLADANNDICLNNTAMINARKVFADCSGYDILFEGPICSQSDMEVVSAMIPSSYYTIAHCLYNAQAPFCSAISGYLDYIESSTSVDCAACYIELQTDLAVLALADEKGVCKDDVRSDTCVVYMATAFEAFSRCSGFTIGV